MAKRQKPRKRRPESVRKGYKAQQDRNPMLQVRLPRSLYTSLQKAATADHRKLADWMRLNLPRLLPQTAKAESYPEWAAAAERFGMIAESSDPPTGEPK